MIAWLALPLEVLPGWPVPEPTSTLHMLMLTLLGPLAALAVLAVIGWTPRLMRKARVGAAGDGIALSDDQFDDEAAITSDESPARRAAVDS